MLSSRGVLGGAVRLTAVLAFCLFVAGCASPESRSVLMKLSAVNTDDKILVVEGTTDLPSGAPLVAELQDRDGQSLLRDQSKVRQGGFFFDFDLRALSEFKSYRLVVTFDPHGAPISVLHEIGITGEALSGDGVLKLPDRRIFRTKVDVLLSSAALGQDWEGRNFSEMEPRERTRLTEELERFIIEKPKDRPALLSLARAYLASEPGEYAMGSRAHQLLLRAAKAPEKTKTGRQARELLAKVERADRQKQVAKAERKAERGVGRYKRNFKIVPGKSLGGFRMGAPYRVISRYFKLEKPADFSKGVDPVVKIKKFHGISLTYGRTSQRMIAARTTSAKYRSPEGLGVGSLLQEAQQVYGKGVVPTPEFVSIGKSKEGKKLYRGVSTGRGIEFEITREVDVEFGIPVDKISAVTVLRRR